MRTARPPWRSAATGLPNFSEQPRSFFLLFPASSPSCSINNAGLKNCFSSRVPAPAPPPDQGPVQLQYSPTCTSENPSCCSAAAGTFLPVSVSYRTAHSRYTSVQGPDRFVSWHCSGAIVSSAAFISPEIRPASDLLPDQRADDPP